ncbi:MAG: alcohol dehydrogenase, partial [Spirochaetes bacterium]
PLYLFSLGVHPFLFLLKLFLTQNILHYLMLPYVMEYNLPGNFEKYAKIAEFMGEKVDNLSDSDAAIKSVEAVKRLQKNVGIPSRLRDYNIKKEDLSKLVEGGMKQARLFVPNPRNLSKEDVEKIYEMAY